MYVPATFQKCAHQMTANEASRPGEESSAQLIPMTWRVCLRIKQRVVAAKE